MFHSKEPYDPNNPNLHFSYGKCDWDFDESVLGVRDSQWIDSHILVVRALVSLNCAERILWGNYILSREAIVLEYKSPWCRFGRCAECICAHELVYRITGLEHLSYRFELVRLR